MKNKMFISGRGSLDGKFFKCCNCFLFVSRDKKKIVPTSERWYWSQLFRCQISKSIDKKWRHSCQLKLIFPKFSGNDVIMAPKWRHISKFQSSFEKRDQYDFFLYDDQLFTTISSVTMSKNKFFLYRSTGHIIIGASWWPLWHHFLVKNENNIGEPREYV